MRSCDRVVLIVLDSVGVGAAPPPPPFGAAGGHTQGNIAPPPRGGALPNLGRLGLGNLTEVVGVPPVGAAAAGAFGRCTLAQPGKETLTGHWELAGINIDVPFRNFPGGFPAPLIDALVERAGLPGVLGNKLASGTEIIAELGEEHQRSGKPIIYGSADSVFQIAAHEAVIPVARLYEIGRAARELCQGPYRIGRIIARPFVGEPGAYLRTERRHDFAVEPPPMLLDFVQAAGLAVQAVGKIADVYCGHGVTRSLPTKDNPDGISKLHACLDNGEPGLIFANLVDFDQLYGHRRNVAGYARALEATDAAVPGLLASLGPRDALFFVADHGNDPTFPGTDHTREYVPVLAAGGPVRPGANLGTRPTLADVGATAAALLGARWAGCGASFADRLLA